MLILHKHNSSLYHGHIILQSPIPPHANKSTIIYNHSLYILITSQSHHSSRSQRVITPSQSMYPTNHPISCHNSVYACHSALQAIPIHDFHSQMTAHIITHRPGFHAGSFHPDHSVLLRGTISITRSQSMALQTIANVSIVMLFAGL